MLKECQNTMYYSKQKCWGAWGGADVQTGRHHYAAKKSLIRVCLWAGNGSNGGQFLSPAGLQGVITVPSGGTCTRNNQEDQSRGIKYPKLLYTEGYTTIGRSEPWLREYSRVCLGKYHYLILIPDSIIIMLLHFIENNTECLHIYPFANSRNRAKYT